MENALEPVDQSVAVWSALVATTGQKVAFAELAQQYDTEALEVIVAAMRDEAAPMSVRVAAANSLLASACAGGCPGEVRKAHYGVRWLPPDPADNSKLIEQEPD